MPKPKVSNDTLQSDTYLTLLSKILFQQHVVCENIDIMMNRIRLYLQEGRKLVREERHVAAQNGDAEEIPSSGEGYSLEPLLNNQHRYYMALCIEWMHLRHFHKLFAQKMKGLIGHAGIEMDGYSIGELPEPDFLMEGYEDTSAVLSTDTEETALNDQLENVLSLISGIHYKSTDYSELQDIPSSFATQYRMPIVHLHRFLARFKVKAIALYRLHASDQRKKSSLMSCSCSRLLALSERIIQFPESQFRIFLSMDYNPLEVESYNGKKRKEYRTEVDLIQDELAWFKFKEANRKKIQLVFEGMSESSSHKCVTTIADELLSAAKAHPFHFHTPTVFMEFLNGLTLEVAEDLIARGVYLSVRGVPLKTEDSGENNVAGKLPFDVCTMLDESEPSPADQEEEEALSELLSQQQLPDEFAGTPKTSTSTLPAFSLDLLSFYPKLVNLDVTALIVLCADITHGYSSPDQATPNFQYNSQHSLIVPRLMKFLEGREWICTKQAQQDFFNILYTVAGEDEIKRAQDVFATNLSRVVENDPSERFLKLKGFNPQHINIFGTADKMNAITVTSNQTLVNRINQHGLHGSFWVYNNHTVRLGLRTEYYKNVLSRKASEKE